MLSPGLVFRPLCICPLPLKRHARLYFLVQGSDSSWFQSPWEEDPPSPGKVDISLCLWRGGRRGEGRERRGLGRLCGGSFSPFCPYRFIQSGCGHLSPWIWLPCLVSRVTCVSECPPASCFISPSSSLPHPFLPSQRLGASSSNTCLPLPSPPPLPPPLNPAPALSPAYRKRLPTKVIHTDLLQPGLDSFSHFSQWIF